MKKFNVLVIGCGSVGQRHARLLSQRQDVDLYAADSFADNLSACMKIADIKKSWRDFKDALDHGMDGVFICTPNESHVPIALEAIKKTSVLMIEKPVSDSLDEALKLSGLIGCNRILVGYMNRFNTQLQKVKKYIESGELGTIAYINASVYTYATLVNAKTDFRDKVKWTLVSDYTHELDFMRYLVGDACEVFAMAAKTGELEHMPDPNIVEIIMRFESGAIGTVHMDYIRDPEKRSLEIVGDRGSIELYIPQGKLRLYKSGKPGFEENQIQFSRDDVFTKQIDNFIGVLNDEEEPFVTIEDGIVAARLADAVIRSCKTRMPVLI